LSAAGLVQARQGSGYTVRSFHDHGGPDLLPGIVDLAREDGTFAAVVRDLLRVRRHLARAVVEQLSDHPPSIGALDAFDESVVAFAEVIADAPEDDAAVGDADLAVLGALLRATGSTVLTLCLNPVCAVVRDLPALRRALYCDPVANLRGWRALGLLLRSSDLAEEPKVALDALSALLDARDRATLDRLGASP
jgi:DNA-binding FadR family transcriptional regulator